MGLGIDENEKKELIAQFWELVKKGIPAFLAFLGATLGALIS